MYGLNGFNNHFVPGVRNENGERPPTSLPAPPTPTHPLIPGFLNVSGERPPTSLPTAPTPTYPLIPGFRNVSGELPPTSLPTAPTPTNHPIWCYPSGSCVPNMSTRPPVLISEINEGQSPDGHIVVAEQVDKNMPSCDSSSILAPSFCVSPALCLIPAYNCCGHVPQVTSCNLPEGRHTYRGRSYVDRNAFYYRRPTQLPTPSAFHRYGGGTATYIEPQEQQPADLRTYDNNQHSNGHTNNN